MFLVFPIVGCRADLEHDVLPEQPAHHGHRAVEGSLLLHTAGPGGAEPGLQEHQEEQQEEEHLVSDADAPDGLQRLNLFMEPAVVLLRDVERLPVLVFPRLLPDKVLIRTFVQQHLVLPSRMEKKTT